MIRPVIKLIRALQSNAAPGEIASGAALSLYFGLTPLNHTHVIFLVLAFLFFKINRATTIVCFPLVKLLYVLGLSHAADGVGHFLLVECALLKPFWTWFTHAPILSYLDFHYTLVLGGFVLAALLTVPVYLAVIKGVHAYRHGLREKINNWGLLKWFKGLTIFKWIYSWWPKG